MAMYVVKSFYIQITWSRYGSTNGMRASCLPNVSTNFYDNLHIGGQSHKSAKGYCFSSPLQWTYAFCFDKQIIHVLLNLTLHRHSYGQILRNVT